MVHCSRRPVFTKIPSVAVLGIHQGITKHTNDIASGCMALVKLNHHVKAIRPSQLRTFARYKSYIVTSPLTPPPVRMKHSVLLNHHISVIIQQKLMSSMWQDQSEYITNAYRIQQARTHQLMPSWLMPHLVGTIRCTHLCKYTVI